MCFIVVGFYVKKIDWFSSLGQALGVNKRTWYIIHDLNVCTSAVIFYPSALCIYTRYSCACSPVVPSRVLEVRAAAELWSRVTRDVVRSMSLHCPCW